MTRFRERPRRAASANLPRARAAAAGALALVIVWSAAGYAQDLAVRGVKPGMSLAEAAKIVPLDASQDLIAVSLPGEVWPDYISTDAALDLRLRNFPLVPAKDRRNDEEFGVFVFRSKLAELSAELAPYKDKVVAVFSRRVLPLSVTDKSAVVAELVRAYGQPEGVFERAVTPSVPGVHVLAWGAKLVRDPEKHHLALLSLVDSHKVLLAVIAVPSAADKDRRLTLDVEAFDYDIIEHAATVLQIMKFQD